MGTPILEVKDLRVSVGEKEILKGVGLTIHSGETHVVMGPNGTGKSTLVNTIMAHPGYTVDEGDICFLGESILEKPADERARLGIFMSFQQAFEVPGITLENFLRAAKTAVLGKQPGILAFRKELYGVMDELQMDHAYAARYLNVGFSGGERKKSEILQMKVLNPTLALLDETDSGLDVDAVRIVSEGVSSWMAPEKATLVITHHQRVLEALRPDYVHVMIDGQIALEGGPELAERISREGYQWIREKV